MRFFPSLGLLALMACNPGRLYTVDPDIALVDGGRDGSVLFDGGVRDGASLPDARPDVPFDGGVDVGPTGLAPVSVEHIDLFQTVAVPLLRDGDPVSVSIPVVAGRSAWLRVAVEADSGFAGMVDGRLQLHRGGESMELWDRRSVAGQAPALPGDAFAFEVPGNWLTPDVRFSVSMHTDEGGGRTSARFPADGTDAAMTVTEMPAIEVHLLPLRYLGDGTGRLPAIDDASIANMRAHFTALLPTAELRLRVLEPIDYDAEVLPRSGASWSNALRAVQQARASRGAASHVYYIGLVAPAATHSEYCGGACIGGIGSVNSSNRPDQRSSIAVGYGRENDFFSAIHELGHTMGFPHAPCGGTAGTDPGFPHAGGAIGVWGRDERSARLIPPSASDYMGYCRDQWISDYNYNRVAGRVLNHGDGAARVFATDHLRITVGPFVSPVVDRLLTEPIAADAEGHTRLVALDEEGAPAGEIDALYQPMSMGGFGQWLVEDRAGLGGVVLPSGRRVRF